MFYSPQKTIKLMRGEHDKSWTEFKIADLNIWDGQLNSSGEILCKVIGDQTSEQWGPDLVENADLYTVDSGLVAYTETRYIVYTNKGFIQKLQRTLATKLKGFLFGWHAVLTIQ